VEKVRSFISLMSAPAAKAFSDPVITIAPVSLSPSSLLRASFSSRKRGVQSAFKALGRCNVINPTPGFGAETLMNSYAGSSVEYDLIILGNRDVLDVILEAIGLQTRGFIILENYFGV